MTIYKPLWEYIDMIDYKAPSPAAGTVLQNNFRSAWRHLNPFNMAVNFRSARLQTIPDYLLNRAAKAPDLDSITDALCTILQRKWSAEKEENKTIQVLVGPPGSQLDQVVGQLARKNGWQILGAPTISEIFLGGRTWLENIRPKETHSIVIPRLEKCFLRHQDGLNLIENLIDKLQAPRRNYLIACDSWAWAYLEKVLHINAMLPAPITLSPLDSTRVQFWLPTLAQTSKGQFVFRDSRSGQLIFPASTNYEDLLLLNAQPGRMEIFGDWVREVDFLKQLTAHCRGIHRIIWLIWRESLQIKTNTQEKISSRFQDTEDWYTVWAKPLSELPLPTIPPLSGTIEPMVLHTLLLHSGLSAHLLDLLLPYSHNEIQHALATLSQAGLVVVDRLKTWRISLVGYPAVRRFIHNEGYLVDAF